MNFYQHLNQAIEYLENHLEDNPHPQALSKIVGVNYGILQRIFPLVTGHTITDYVRKRRLTMAGRDLIQSNLRITDLAYKYGYDSAATFSRAFKRFHGYTPSDIRNGAGNLKHFAKIVLDVPVFTEELEYEIIQLGPMQLFGTYIKTNAAHIKTEAPALYEKLELEQPEIEHPNYGMIKYLETRDSLESYEYWMLWTKFREGLTPYRIKPSRWIKLHIPSQEARDIQKMSDQFYRSFLPTCTYELSSEPELEFYHDGVTDFLIPIK